MSNYKSRNSRSSANRNRKTQKKPQDLGLRIFAFFTTLIILTATLLVVFQFCTPYKPFPPKDEQKQEEVLPDVTPDEGEGTETTTPDEVEGTEGEEQAPVEGEETPEPETQGEEGDAGEEE